MKLYLVFWDLQLRLRRVTFRAGKKKKEFSQAIPKEGEGIGKLGFSPWPSPPWSSNPFLPRSPPSFRIWHPHKRNRSL